MPATAVPHPALVYRDATITKATRDTLAELHDTLVHGRNVDRPRALAALRDVIRRWDENDATEATEEDAVFSMRDYPHGKPLPDPNHEPEEGYLA